jgi:tetratricopeptide (TPR) repeat protein/serine/threonine protein kinase
VPSRNATDQNQLVLTPDCEPVPGYRLVKRLGAGGFGEVWEAEAPGGFHVAMKFVSLGEQAGAVERRSLELLKHIHHPNLLTTFGAWQTNGFLIIAMELADGTMWDRFQEAVAQGLSGIPWQELHEYLLEAAKGIDHLNAQKHVVEGEEGVGVQHRDIKPQNILLIGDGVKVADFGLARLLGHTVTGHTGSMTIAYAPPEFFRGQTSWQSDQYSLAVTYCELCSGRLPFTGSAAEIMAGHLMHPPNLTLLVEEEQPVVRKALAKEPKDRWPNCRAFVEALHACRTSAAPALVSAASSAPPGVPPQLANRDPYRTSPALELAEDQLAREFSKPDSSSAMPVPVTAARIIKETASVQGSTTDPSPRGVVTTPKQSSRSRLGRRALIGSAVAFAVVAGFVLWPWGAFRSHRAESPLSGTPGMPMVQRALQSKAALKLLDLRGLTIQAGSKKALKLKFDRQDHENPIEVAFANLPAHVHFPVAIVPSGNASAEVVVEADRDAPAGGYDVGVIARSGDVWQEYKLNVIVEEAPTLRLTVPNRLTLRAGEKLSFPVQAAREGINGAIALRIDNLPVGVTASPAVIAAGRGDVQMELAAALNVDTGDREIRILASARALESRATVKLTVQPAPRVELDVTRTLTFEAGKSVTTLVKVTRTGYTGPIGLAFEGLPDGVSPLENVAIPAGADHLAVTITAAPRLEKVEKEIKVVASGGALRAEVPIRLTIEPTPILVHRKKGKGYARAGEYERAIHEFDEVIRLNAKDARAYNDRGNAFSSQKEYDKAVADYTEAIRIDPKYAFAYGNRGLAHLHKKEYAPAIADCTQAIQIDPKYAKAYSVRGWAHTEKGEYDQAVADCSQAIRLDPKYASAYNNRAYAYLEKGQYGNALADSSKAILLNPKLASAYNCRGSAHRSLMQYDQALADYNEALRLEPKYACVFNNRGLTQKEKGAFEKAIADYGEAIRCDPKFAAAYSNRGHAYNAVGQYDQAIADCNEAIRLRSKMAAAYANRGEAYRAKQQYDKAIADYTKAIHMGQKRPLTYVGRGHAYNARRQYDQAIADCTEAIRLNPRLSSAYDTRRYAYSEKGEYEKALADCQELIRLDPKNAAAYTARACVYLNRGEYDKAIADCDAALRLNPRSTLAHQYRASAYAAK